MTSTMRALMGGAGPEWEVRDIDVPKPGPGQIRVRVRAAAVNRADLYMLQGTYNPRAKTSDLFIAGLEFAGEVDAIGDDVRRWAVGDRVMGVTLGAFASYTLVDHRHVISVPESLSWTDAAALPVALATEHDALAQGGFGLKQSVLIVGATSSVGLIGVQLAKALGASQVIATTTSDSKVDALKSIGADVVVNTSSENLAEAVAAATGGAGADLTLDHVGGQLFADTFLATRVGGTVVNVGRLAGAESTIDLNQLSFRRLRVLGTTFSVRTPDELADACAALGADVVPAMEEGRVRAVVDRVFAFDDAKVAADHMRSNTATGKIVLEMPAS
ncbi:zinc-binding dehydrogenase [Streptomyces coacervatus]|uniref:Zinc-binding dehydrogenase n=1 Tax=Streptomyces coacervatus TaxID=647381 RepID=A0ABP7IVB9_9ACTN|nr:zinc-binding dehydrogenase [Streptomyces coacervatus]MDF2269727.1 zinc-binding dehydrogenase [Streptomyces coacervatus]